MTDQIDSLRPLARAPRGMHDRRARDLAAERRIVAAVSGVYERFGFEALDTGAFEYADALGKFLPDADRPNEGVFALQDDDDQWMALRYDLTAPLARFAAERWNELPKPFRRYAVGPVWRNEKPGPGRYREFWQCDADTVGSARPEADAEIVALAVAGFEAAGLPADATMLKLNDRRLLDGLLAERGVTDSRQKLAVLRAIDKFDRLGWPGVRDLLGKERRDDSGDVTPGADVSVEVIAGVEAFLGAGASARGDDDWGRADTLKALELAGLGSRVDPVLEELAQIDRALTGMGVGSRRAVFDPTVVRGLEYYTGPVFEAELLLDVRSERGEALRFGSVGGGGRYDDLVARFTGERVPATGFSFGVSRLAAALSASGRAPAAPRGPVVVLALSADDMPAYFEIADALRNPVDGERPVAAEVYLGESGMRAQLKYADRRLSPAAVIFGSDERAAGTVTIKDLDAGRAASAGIADNAAWKAERPGQVTVARAELVATVRRIVG